MKQNNFQPKVGDIKTLSHVERAIREGLVNDIDNLPKPTLQEQKDIILSILTDFADEGSRLIAYLDHIGFDLCALTSPHNLGAAVLGHYRIKAGQYDIDRACDDLASWPPIAAEIRKRMGKKVRV